MFSVEDFDASRS